MDVTWHGLGCFRLKDRGYPAIVTDPFEDREATGLVLPSARADIVISSVPMLDPKVADYSDLRQVSHVLAGPGEYEIGGVFITGVATARAQSKDAAPQQNIAYACEINDVVVCHLGALGGMLTQAQIEALGRVDVLLIPVGLSHGLKPGKAAELVSIIEPDIVIPMEYQVPGLQVEREPVDRFLKEMGEADKTPVPTLKISSSDVGGEETRVVILEPERD
jgi:L-ascorbate metabolism protein UlaG (beta-lactamase superfamily)